MAFIKNNLNPKNLKTDDCAIRAVGLATRLGWDEAYHQLSDIGFETKRAMNAVEVVEQMLINNGFKIGSIKIHKGEHRPTVAEFAAEHPDWYCVLRVANHLVATGKGNYVDTWDCGGKAVYKYWYKPIN